MKNRDMEKSQLQLIIYVSAITKQGFCHLWNCILNDSSFTLSQISKTT